MTKWRVLAVDDDPMILQLIKNLLKKESCLVETSANASQAWEILEQPDSCFDFMVLDRFLPNIDGLDLLRRIKADSRLGAMPVIMQSGASSAEQVAEGIEAGAFYYLTKPWLPNALTCIVHAVMADIELHRAVASRDAREIASLRFFTRAELRFSTLEDVGQVAAVLAALCPDPEQAARGLLELLLNAVEHGNLGIGYAEKKELMYEDRWEEELRSRLALPEFRQLSATVTFERRCDALVFRVSDQGGGFQWAKYLELDPERSVDPNGRGIAMARRYSFSGLEYQGAGNVVVATVALPEAAPHG